MGLHRYIRQILVGSALLIGTIGVVAPARGHFILMAPDSWMSQNTIGDPQKVGPCGEEGGGTITGKLTAFRPGESIEITINEKIPHPGHYRVALAVNDRSELPLPPAVARVDNDPCGSTEIQDPPVFPILLDNALPHTQRLQGPQTFTVTLPTDVTCTKCTLQVIEYMSNHGMPCFYHHCADISIQGDVATPTATATPIDAPPITPTATATPVVGPPPAGCVGDCDGNGAVTIDEIVALVAIALEQVPIAMCEAGNINGNQQIAVNEILTAVNSALHGCR